METLEAEDVIQVIEILFPDLYNEKDLVLKDYKLSINILVDIIII
jgi:hypothetical protein